ncbi:MAG: hypothetical protein ABSA97_09385 [Verrucomicrobiia bacterium]
MGLIFFILFIREYIRCRRFRRIARAAKSTDAQRMVRFSSISCGSYFGWLLALFIIHIWGEPSELNLILLLYGLALVCLLAAMRFSHAAEKARLRLGLWKDEAKQLAEQGKALLEQDAVMQHLFETAAKLEAKDEYDEAITHYQTILMEQPTSDLAKEARACIEAIEKRRAYPREDAKCGAALTEVQSSSSFTPTPQTPVSQPPSLRERSHDQKEYGESLAYKAGKLWGKTLNCIGRTPGRSLKWVFLALLIMVVCSLVLFGISIIVDHQTRGNQWFLVNWRSFGIGW